MGFTLIEMMIVVAIIAILASLAIAYYRDFRYRSIRSEAYVNLGAIRVCEESYGASKEHYLTIPWDPTNIPSRFGTTQWDVNTNFETIGFLLKGRHWYHYGVAGYGATGSDHAYWKAPPGSAGIQPIHSEKLDICIAAEGDLDGDGEVSQLFLTEEGGSYVMDNTPGKF